MAFYCHFSRSLFLAVAFYHSAVSHASFHIEHRYTPPLRLLLPLILF
jgi:hypothetical protein